MAGNDATDIGRINVVQVKMREGLNKIDIVAINRQNLDRPDLLARLHDERGQPLDICVR
jgi:hypothetical protein